MVRGCRYRPACASIRFGTGKRSGGEADGTAAGFGSSGGGHQHGGYRRLGAASFGGHQYGGPWVQSADLVAEVRDGVGPGIADSAEGQAVRRALVDAGKADSVHDIEWFDSREGDNPADFLDLVMELRESKASSYTLKDTPTFTCVQMSLWDMMDTLGGAGSAQAVSRRPARADGPLAGRRS